MLLPIIEAAVLLEIAELQKHGGITDWHIRQAQNRMDAMFTTPDMSEGLLYKTKHSSEAFAAIVTALAVMAFFPGGVTFAGMHFEVKPDE